MTATTTCKVYLRRGPDKGFFYPVKRVPRGRMVTVLESHEDWLQVSVDGLIGYLPRDASGWKAEMTGTTSCPKSS